MQNKFVCLLCDEMLFDMEIEVDGSTPLVKKMIPTEAKPKAKLLRLVDKKITTEKEPEKQDLDSIVDEDETTKKKAA